MTFSVREVSLGEVCEIKQGRYLAPNQMEQIPTEESFAPVIGGNGVLGYTNQSTFSFPVPLVTCRGSKCGLMQWAEPPTWISNNAMAVYFKENQGDNFFLHQYLLNSNFDDVTTGSAQPQITVTNLSLKRILLPDLKTQKSISSLMKNIEGKIATNNILSNTLEAIAQTIFKSWFIDFDPVKAKMAREKPAGMDDATAALFPDSMEESEFGLIPKSWKVRSLFDCGLEIESGSRPKGGVKGITSGVPSIGAESINGLGVFDFSKTKYVPRDFYDKMNKGKPQDFDILLYKDGGKPGEFKPRVGMYGLGFPFSEYGINEHVFILRAKDIGNPYLYFWIRLERTLDILRNRGVKAAIPGINQQDVGTIPILQPSKDVLKAFNELAMPSISLILTLASESMKLANLRDTVLPRLISGELQISDEMQVP